MWSLENQVVIFIFYIFRSTDDEQVAKEISVIKQVEEIIATKLETVSSFVKEEMAWLWKWFFKKIWEFLILWFVFLIKF